MAEIHSDKLPVPWFTDDVGSEDTIRVFSGAGKAFMDWQEVAMCSADASDGISLQTAQANAEFIVRACNAHDELVAALEEAEAALRRFKELDNARGSDGPCDCPACRACDSIRATLAKARGKS